MSKKLPITHISKIPEKEYAISIAFEDQIKSEQSHSEDHMSINHEVSKELGTLVKKNKDTKVSKSSRLSANNQQKSLRIPTV